MLIFKHLPIYADNRKSGELLFFFPFIYIHRGRCGIECAQYVNKCKSHRKRITLPSHGLDTLATCFKFTVCLGVQLRLKVDISMSMGINPDKLGHKSYNYGYVYIYIYIYPLRTGSAIASCPLLRH